MQKLVRQDIISSVTMVLGATTRTSSWSGQTIKSIHPEDLLKGDLRAKSKRHFKIIFEAARMLRL